MTRQCSETSSVMQNRAVDSGNDPVVWHSFGEHPASHPLGTSHCVICTLLYACCMGAAQALYKLCISDKISCSFPVCVLTCRCDTHCEAGGLPCHASGARRLHPQAVRLLLGQPCGRPAVRRQRCEQAGVLQWRQHQWRAQQWDRQWPCQWARQRQRLPLRQCLSLSGKQESAASQNITTAIP